MKKQLVILLAAAMTASLLAGCGASSAGSGADGSTSSQAEGRETDGEYEEDDAPMAYYTTVGEEVSYEGEDDSGDSYELYYAISLYDDGSALFDEDTWYCNGVHSTVEYCGTYEMDGDRITFKYGDDEAFNVYTMRIQGSNICDVQCGAFDTEGASEVAGTYTGTTEYGDATLTVNDDGSAVMDCGDIVLKGNIFAYSDMWDFMGSSEDNEISVDWMIAFDGDSFTYDTYSHVMFGPFAGEYILSGDLGTFTMTVDEDGGAEADVMISGASRHLTGSVICDAQEGVLVSAYLSGEKYSLSVDLTTSDDGSYNYYGSISLELSAG